MASVSCPGGDLGLDGIHWGTQVTIRRGLGGFRNCNVWLSASSSGRGASVVCKKKAVAISFWQEMFRRCLFRIGRVTFRTWPVQ